MWQRNFRLLWLGQAVNDLGSALTGLALPLVAAVTLRASTFEVGVLTALGTLGWMVVSLPAGAIVDRVPAKRLLMVCCDIGRLLVVLAIPALAAVGRLAIVHVWAAAALVSVLTVVFEIGYWSLVPAVMRREQLVGAHSKIAMTNGLGQVAGPAVAGAMVSALGSAVRVLLLDAGTFVVSILTLLAMRTPPIERARPRRAMVGEISEGIALPARRTVRARLGRAMAGEISEGVAFVWANPLLRRIVAFSSVYGLCDGMAAALLVLYLLRQLDASPAVVGLVSACGAVGGTVGAALAAPLSRRLGTARLLWLAPLACGAPALLIPAAWPGHGVWLVAAGVFVPSFGMVIFHVLQISYRQAICPAALQGRMNATVRWIIRSGRPPGAILGGLLGTGIGLRPTLLLAALGSWLSAVVLWRSDLRGLKDLPLTDHVGGAATLRSKDGARPDRPGGTGESSRRGAAALP
ncbi:MFS transporter [Rhizocola hellebori]|uniref:MFS transporter n=1 Tax=Rhizocola hellebori TaxID=1392758 RepID=A0A8J3QJ57_9ACTN|nr:MFS transporter [Rhizocola hellebori]GIH10714.1 MFS transporter [Rhizocola hellebori]